MTTKEIYTKEGYRLAPYLLRFAAFAVDAAIFVATVVGLFCLLYPFGVFPTLGDINGTAEGLVLQEKYDEASRLYKKVDGQLQIVSSSDYRDYEEAVYQYYFVFNAADNADNPHPEAYTMAQYNTAVYDLPSIVTESNRSQYYVFSTDENGKPNANLRGQLNPSILNDDGSIPAFISKGLLDFHKAKYEQTYYLLAQEPYYVEAVTKLKTGTIMIELIASLVPLLAFYLAAPIFDVVGRTIGKRIMKIGCATIMGTVPKKWQIALRVLVAVVCVVVAVLWDDLTLSLIFLVAMFLISSGMATFGRTRRCLHDYVSQLVVVRQQDIKEEALVSHRGEDGAILDEMGEQGDGRN
ncbi:MAG: RDD family protein [Bacilli bacterium]|nr:RDD family protein [Bacilli bacterium]